MISLWHPAAPSAGRFTNSRSALTALAEDLARQAPRRDRKEEVAASRAADVCFVLDELTGAHPAWPGAGWIDLSRIAMAGHSAGGAAAIATMLADSRIRAGIDMDGSTAAPIPDEGLARPFLFLGKQSSYTPGSRGAVTTLRDWKLLRGAVTTWERDWELLTGWKRWLVVAGAVHASFTDLALLADQE
jgi:Platelet-activating factor acetylhydrolase, isoform II